MFCVTLDYLHRRRKAFNLKVTGGKVNEEGPDLFGGDGHVETLVSMRLLIVWNKEKKKESNGGCATGCVENSIS